MKRKSKESLAKIILLKLAEMAIAHFEAFQWPYWKRYPRQTTYKTISRLKKKGLIEIQKRKDKITFKITKKGKRKVLEYKLDGLFIKKPKKWDKKWRIVTFDIPNQERVARDFLRNKLKELGFYSLQKSVFIYPYECKKEIDFIKEMYKIEPYIRYIVAESIEGQKEILKYFKL